MTEHRPAVAREDMDPFSKALEHAERDGHSVREWMKPTTAQSAAPVQEPASVFEPRPVELDPRHLHSHLVLTGTNLDDPVIVDRYRVLRTQLVQRMKAHDWSRLAITSPGPKAGKTLTATNLAISIARDGSQPVVLIDADLRKPTIAETLGIEGGAGLVDYLKGDAAMEQVAVAAADLPNLLVVPGRPAEPDEARPELLSSPRMLTLLGEVAQRDRWTAVIVDLPPVFVGDDVMVLAEHMHGVLLIVEEGATEIGELTGAAELLAKFNLLGTVLNSSTEKRREYADYYYAASSNGRRGGSSRRGSNGKGNDGRAR